MLYTAQMTPCPYSLAREPGGTTTEEITIMRKRTVKLHGHHCEISVHREGKHVWFAVGAESDVRSIQRQLDDLMD